MKAVVWHGPSKVSVDEVAEAAGRLLAPANFTGVVVGDIGVLEYALLGLGNVEFG